MRPELQPRPVSLDAPPSVDSSPVAAAPAPRDRRNPDLWRTLLIDRGVPVDPETKEVMVRDLQNWTRNYLLVPTRLVANVALAVVLVFKRLVPLPLSFYGAMHHIIYWFLKTFATPEANFLLMRHFWIESNLVNFILDNGPAAATAPRAELFPRELEALKDNAFNQHDWNLYNALLDDAEAKNADPQWRERPRGRVNYEGIRPIELSVEACRTGRLQFLDFETSLELFKMFYPSFLTNYELDRAVISLQLDENIFVSVAEITGDWRWLYLVTNRHPLSPESKFQGARNLFHHILVTEYLHHDLELKKERAQRASRAVNA